MTNDQLYTELYEAIADIINEFVKGGGDPEIARRMAFDATRQAANTAWARETSRVQSPQN